MGRLIDADELYAAFRRDIMGGLNYDRILREAKPVDAVPVVRCKDCRFSDWYTTVDGKERCYCMEHGSSGHEEMDFCSYGENDGEHEQTD